MKFLAVLALAVGFVSAADLCRSTGSACSGNIVCCAGIQEGRCCTLNANKKNLVYTLPNNSRGQGWTGSNCNGQVGEFKNPTASKNRCIAFSWNVNSAKWLVGGGTKREVEDNEPCAELDTAYYEVDGKQRKVKIPSGQGEVVSDWIEDGEWQKLAALEDA